MRASVLLTKRTSIIPVQVSFTDIQCSAQFFEPLNL
jgi:hypothetical protein